MMGCDDLEWWNRRGEGGSRERGDFIYIFLCVCVCVCVYVCVYIYMSSIYMYIKLWLIQVVVWQKPTQHCKATILQFKIIGAELFSYYFACTDHILWLWYHSGAKPHGSQHHKHYIWLNQLANLHIQLGVYSLPSIRWVEVVVWALEAFTWRDKRLETHRKMLVVHYGGHNCEEKLYYTGLELLLFPAGTDLIFFWLCSVSKCWPWSFRSSFMLYFSTLVSFWLFSLDLVNLSQFWLPAFVPAVTLTSGYSFLCPSSVHILSMLCEGTWNSNDLWNFFRFPSSPESFCVHCTPFSIINCFVQFSHKIEKIRIILSESWKDT